MTTTTAAAPFRLVLAGAVLAALTGALVAATNGNIAVALAPIALLAAVVWALRAPLGTLAALAVFAGLLFDNVAERPGMGLFKTPLYKPGEFLYAALERTLGVPGLKVFGLEVLFACIGVLWLVRGRARRERGAPLPATALLWACGVASAACLVWAAWGLARGGNMSFAMLQFRPMLFACALPILLGFCFGETRWIRAVIAICMIVAVVRNGFAIYYYWAIVRHGVKGSTDLGGGSYVTTHSDSVLATVVLLCIVVTLYETPRLRSFVVAGLVLPVVGIGTVLNNRRLAVVAFVIALFFIYAIANKQLRRRVHLTLAFLMPLFVLWMTLGWSSNAGWARPVRTIRSVLVKSDSSSQTRDVENYNLGVTMKRKPVMGWGFGHPYIEHVRMYDISHEFEAYLYVPHNAVLWLFTAVGVIGFPLLWWPFLAIVFLAARTYRSPRAGPDERVLALITIGVVITHGVQSFGDMGLQSWMGALILGSFGGLIGVAAVRTGAWPEKKRRAGAAT